MGSILITKKRKPKKALCSCTAGEDVHFLGIRDQLLNKTAVFAGCPTPWGCLEGCPGSCIQKQVHDLATTTSSTSAALIPLNSISQRALIHTAAGEGWGEGEREKSNVLLKPSKAQMPITQLHHQWHKACIVHIGCRFSWECL